jgi:hypothetical protein
MRALLALVLLTGTAFATDKPPQSPTPAPTAQADAQAYAAAQAKAQTGPVSQSVTTAFNDRLQIPYTPPANAPSMPTNHSCALGESDAWSIPVAARSTGKHTVDPQCEFRALVLVALAVDPCLARKLLGTHPAIAIIQTGEIVCVPPETSTVTRADLDRVEQESKARDDAVFRQTMKK